MNDNSNNDVGTGREIAFLAGEIDDGIAPAFQDDHFGGSALLVEIESLASDLELVALDLHPKSFAASLAVESMIGGVTNEGPTPDHLLLVDAGADSRSNTFIIEEDTTTVIRPFTALKLPLGKTRFSIQFARANSGRGTFELAFHIKRRDRTGTSSVHIMDDLRLAFMEPR